MVSAINNYDLNIKNGTLYFIKTLHYLLKTHSLVSLWLFFIQRACASATFCACALKNKMASQPQARRRQWGKSRETGKVVIVENMDLGAPDRVDEGIGEKKRDGNGVKSSEKGLDLQHPEMLSNESLVRILTQYYVPIPAGTDDESNREKLMSLFRMHVQPRPQRQRRHHRKRDKSQGTPTQLITTSLSNMDWPNKEDETDVTSTWDCVATSLNRKR